MVTSPHDLASRAGAEVLARGGNAIEAAIAIGAVLAVTYPHFCGLGGDAIWIVADRSGRRRVFSAIGQAAAHPPAADPIPTRGPLAALTSAAVVDGWGHALDWSARHWGGRETLARLIEPAIVLAEEGFPVSPSQAFWLDFRKAETAGWPGFASVFGAAHSTGTPFRQPQLAETLKAIAAEGARGFYEGALARRIAAGLAAAGSPLDAADLAATRTREETPLALDYRGLTLLAPPPPTQGVTTLGIMGTLAAFPMEAIDEGGADFYHLCVEAVKAAFDDRRGLADPDFAPQAVEAWLSAGRLAAHAAGIDRDRARPWPPKFQTGDTVFLAAADAEGGAVSVLQSLYYDWGSGVVAGDTGILWQNRGAAFGRRPDDPNRLAPGKRPFYTLNPGLALDGDRPHLLYGTQGADGQPQTLAVLLSRLIDHRLDPAEALRRPRFLLGRTFSDGRDTLKIEVDAGEAVIADLIQRGHEVARLPAGSPLAGQAGVIRIDADGSVTGAHDPRSDGRAIGVDRPGALS
ncbi:gamma-glutamyltransferase [Siculibacillus lacustris]|uniref:Gamma-glutamyltransferase n=1 Tax=Siculibacillus lacustris TaxID=1549641 RepID=A0A4Q9VY51_9HYPH|nr:gamma-glutamyltransferase [Siculibacillus lacustris]TBW41437.1 gamma-glutamyltransferase [Siculibacillus lacustris]